jgi:predicted nucleic acid-binding protein
VILLDTNVVSELMRPEPSARVMGWSNARTPTALFLSAVSEAEVRRGVAILPEGRRRDALKAQVDVMIAMRFTGRIAPFDSAAAIHYADVVAPRRAARRPISEFDAQIAAIARSRGFALATRTVADFEGCGVPLIDPWSA